MGPKKGRRVRKIEVPTDTVPEFELGAQQLISSGGGRTGRPEREREGTASATDGRGGKEGGGKSGGSCRKKARNREKWWGSTITVMIQEVAHDQHISH